MQYNININQKQLYELSITLDCKINLKTASILNYFKEAHTVFKVKIINNTIFYKINYQKILDQNPLLDIEIKQLSRHFDLLVKMKILKKEVVKSNGTEVYFAPDENYIRCFFEIPEDKNVLSTGQKSSVPEDKKVLSLNKHKINKHILKKDKINFNAEDYLKTLDLDQNILSLLLSWLEIRKIKKTPTTQKAIDLNLKNLEKFNLDDQKEFIEKSILSGWTGLYCKKETIPDYKKQPKFGVETPQTYSSITM